MRYWEDTAISNVVDEDISFADAALYGTVGAVTSGVLGIANSAIALGNTVLSDDNQIDQIDTAESLGALMGDSAKSYYEANSQWIDMAGLIGSSFIPGGLAVKGVQALRAGKIVTSFKALGLENGVAGKYLNQASVLARTGNPEGMLAGIRSLQWKGIAGAGADALVDNTAASVAILAAVNQNPLLNEDGGLGYFESFKHNFNEFVNPFSGSLSGVLFLGDWGFRSAAVYGRMKNQIGLAETMRRADWVVEDAGQLAVSGGDKASVYYNAMKVKEWQINELKGELGPVSAFSRTGIENEVRIKDLEIGRKRAEENFWTSMSEMIGKSDPELRGVLQDLVGTKDIETLAGYLSGVERFSRINRMQMFQSATGVPDPTVKLIDDLDALEIKNNAISRGEDPTKAEGYRTALGLYGRAGLFGDSYLPEIAVRKDEYLKKFLPGMSEEDRAMSVFLHEYGHHRTIGTGLVGQWKRGSAGNLNPTQLQRMIKAKGELVDQKMLQDRNLVPGMSNEHLMGLSKELEAISRIQRPDIWKEIDDLQAILDNPNSDPLKAWDAENLLKQKHEYAYSTSELMADAAAQFMRPGLDQHQSARLAPKLHRYFKKHQAIFETLSTRQMIYDRVSKQTFATKTLPSVGDFGNVKLSKDGSSLLYGDGQVSKIGLWDPKKMTALEADAQWAGWELRARNQKYDMDWDELDGDNLPQIQAWINKMEREKGQEAANEFVSVKIGEDSLEWGLPELKNYLIQEKETRMAMHRKELLDTRTEVNIDDNFMGMARKYNTNTEFAELGSSFKGSIANVYGSFDPTQPRHVVLTANKRVAFDDTSARSFLNLQNRVLMQISQAKNVAAATLGPGMAERIVGLSGNATLENTTKTDVTSVSSTRGFFSSMNAALGSFQAKAQTVGRNVRDAILQQQQAISKDFADNFFSTINNKQALVEVNTLIATELRGADRWTHIDNLTPEERIIADVLLQNQDATMVSALVNRDAINDMTSKFFRSQDQSDAALQAIAKAAMEKYGTRTYLPLRTMEASGSLAWMEKYIQDYSKTAARLANTAGKQTNWAHDYLYIPPPDVSHYTHVAFLNSKSPDGLLAGSERGVIVASSGDELAQKIATLKDTYGEEGITIATKDEIIAYKKSQAEYDADLMVKERTFDSKLRKTGALSTPFVRSDNLEIAHLQKWVQELAAQNVRNATSLAFAQEIAEMKQMSTLFGSASSSKWQGLSRVFRSEGNDPWQNTIDVLLNKNNYGKQAPIWKALGETVDSGFTTVLAPVYNLFRKNPTIMDMQAVNAEMSRRGYEAPYKTVADLALANTQNPTQLLSKFVAQANAVTAFFTLGVDTLAAVTNAIGLPVLLVPELVASKKLLQDPDFMAKFGVAAPDGSMMPTSTKAITKAINALFTDDVAKARYEQMGFIGDQINVMKQAMTDLALPSEAFNRTGSKAWQTINEGASKAAQAARKYSGVDYSENAVRFIVANVAEQLADAAKITDPGDRLSLINTIMNRVHGNYTAAQRPLLFQGVIGQAIGLFQTYQFNVMQQVFRNWGEGNKKAVAIMGGLQASLFGVRGIPGYEVISTHAIGEANPDNADLNSFLYGAFGDSRDPVLNRRLADWFVYGVPSNFFHLDIYNRGDLNPRNATIIPTTISEIPAFNIGTRFFTNLANTSRAIGEAGLNGNVLLEGLAHNALNRPLAGLATQILGYRTTGSGNKLLFAQEDEQNILSWSAALVGGKPIDEAIALDTLYRKVGYDSARTEKLNKLGSSYRAAIRAGEIPDTVDLLRKYQQDGGRIETFNRWFQTVVQGANESQMQKIVQDSNSPAAAHARAIIGTDRSLGMRYVPSLAGTEEATEEAADL